MGEQKLCLQGLPEKPPSNAAGQTACPGLTRWVSSLVGSVWRGEASPSLLLSIPLWLLWSGPWGGPWLGGRSPRLTSVSPSQTCVSVPVVTGAVGIRAATLWGLPLPLPLPSPHPGRREMAGPAEVGPRAQPTAAPCCSPVSASHRGPGWSLGRLLLSPPWLPWVALGRWALPAPPLVMPLGHPRVSPKMSLGGLREPEGVGAPWRPSWGRCPWRASSCSWPRADRVPRHARGPGGHRARLGLAEAWAGGVCRPWVYSRPRPCGRWQAVSKIENGEISPGGGEGEGRIRVEAGGRQGWEGGSPHTPLSAPALPDP